MAIADQIDSVESGGNPTAANPRSSAEGIGQFIAPTFLSVIKQHFPQLAQGRSDAEILSLRADPTISRAATAAYAGDNQDYLAKNGLPVTAGTVYLAHFAGPKGAAKILQADPGASVADILGQAAVKANPFLQGMTAQGLRAWAARKMGAAAPQPGTQNNAQAASPAPQPGAPANILPQGKPPIFANAAPASGANAATGAMPALPAMPQASAPPIFTPPPQPIDLAPLRAALAARLPIFAKQQGLS